MGLEIIPGVAAGSIDYCVASDALAIDAHRPKEAGFDVDGPDESGKRLPDGTEIW